MATAVGLNMKITADTAGIGRGMSRTEKALAGLKASTDRAASALRGLVSIEVGKILANGFSRAANAALDMANRLRGTIDETAKLAQRTGIAVEALQGLQVAAGLSGVGNFTEAISKLNVRLGQAAQGNKDVLATLESLGLSFEDLEKMSPEDRFKAVAAAIGGLPSELEKSAAAVKLFEEGGIQLLPLFAQNLDEIQKRAERLGIVLSGDQTKAIEGMNDALFLVQRTFDGIIGQVTANLAPIVTQLVEEFLSFVEAFQGFEGEGGSGIANALTEWLFDFAESLAVVFDTSFKTLRSFGGTMEYVARVFDFVTKSFVARIETLRSVFNVFEVVAYSLLEGLGSILERLGSWVSSDLQAFGKTLKESSQRERSRNIEEGRAAFANAGAATFAAYIGGSIPGAEGDGPAVAALRATRERFANRGQQADAAGVNPVANVVKQQVDELARIETENARKAAAEAERIEKQRLDKIVGLNERYAERSEEIEARRLDALSRQNQEALQVNDIRSGGISQFLALATGREDPAVAEARAQRKELEKIAAEIRKLGGTVELVGVA